MIFNDERRQALRDAGFPFEWSDHPSMSSPLNPTVARLLWAIEQRFSGARFHLTHHDVAPNEQRSASRPGAKWLLVAWFCGSIAAFPGDSWEEVLSDLYLALDKRSRQ